MKQSITTKFYSMKILHNRAFRSLLNLSTSATSVKNEYYYTADSHFQNNANRLWVRYEALMKEIKGSETRDRV